jgi:CO/xanthine dehydrogenase FAD-binding subunit
VRAFAYEKPRSLDGALALLASGGPGARALAGGTDLIIQLRNGAARADLVVDVKGLGELDGGIREERDRLVISARTVMTAIAADERVRRHFRALAEAALVVGSAQIRNRATLAGNICNASPAADTVPAMLVYGADVVTVGPAGERRRSLDSVFVRSGVTTLEPGELVTAIELPLPSERAGSVHLRRTRRRGHDLAAVTLACSVSEGGRLRLAYGSVGPRPVLVEDRSGVLLDAGPGDTGPSSALDRLLAAASPSPRSMRAAPDYRLAMLRVLALRGIALAKDRLGDGSA